MTSTPAGRTRGVQEPTSGTANTAPAPAASSGFKLPRPQRLRGPGTQRRVLRTRVVWGVVVLLGMLPSLAGASSAWQAAGLSFVFPGAGLVYATPPAPGWTWELLLWLLQPVAALLVLAAAGWAAGRIIQRGDYLALPGVFVGSSVLAALSAAGHHSAGGHAHHGTQDWVPATALVLALLIPLITGALNMRNHAAAVKKGDARDAFLARAARQNSAGETSAGEDAANGALAATASHPASFSPVLASPDQGTLADERDRLRMAGWAEALALQPDSEWKGFGSFSDEYLLPAMRYRIWALSVQLSLLHYTHTPAYSGFRQEAMQALIQRMTVKPVWEYWQKEARWGLLSNNPDPIGTRKNIMFSGYLLLMLDMYAKATGDTGTFNQPGALSFRWDDSTRFDYNHELIANRVAQNFTNDELCLWNCEPGLTFPFCNSVALAALQIHDSQHHTQLAADIAPAFFRNLNEEFTAGDGDIYTLQTSRFGIAMRSARGLTNTAQMAALLGPLDPSFEWRTWQLLLREDLEPGRFRQAGPASPTPTDKDWGTGQGSKANALGWEMFLARQRGEDGWYRTLREAARDQFEPAEAQLAPFTSSVHASGVMGLGMAGRENSWRTMLLESSRPGGEGPRLAEAPYPDVQVATAVTDGLGHDAVLYPGQNGGGRYELGFDQLKPGRHYTVHGGLDTEVTGNSEGRATVQVELTDRTVVTLRPA